MCLTPAFQWWVVVAVELGYSVIKKCNFHISKKEGSYPPTPVPRLRQEVFQTMESHTHTHTPVFGYVVLFHQSEGRSHITSFTLA